MTIFSQEQLEAIARAMGHTENGLTGSEIQGLLDACQINDTNPKITKWKRLYNAFATNQNQTRNRRQILGFIRKALKPSRYLNDEFRFELLRQNLNQALSFSGLAVTETGKLIKSDIAKTLEEAACRARNLRASLNSRGVHPDVLKFCKAELVSDNYFHAVLEATKSIADKLRNHTGLTDDGAQLIDRALSGNPPMLAINNFQTESERSEQRGFLNLVKGTFGMFRNPTAHEPRLHWDMQRTNAEDLLSLASLIHRRLDESCIPPRI